MRNKEPPPPPVSVPPPVVSPSNAVGSTASRIGLLGIVMGIVMLVRTIDLVRRALVQPAEEGVLAADGSDMSSAPSAPPALPVAKGGVIPPSNPSLCPICRQKRVNPSASTGGFVFCYSCLSAALSRHPHCPVTGIACQPLDVIRLFEDDLVL